MLKLDTDDLARRYLAGESAQAIAESLGVSSPTVKSRLAAAGVPVRGRVDAARTRRRRFDAAEAVRRYVSGETEQSVAAGFGVTRRSVRRALTEAGVAVRGRSEANALRMAAMPPEERLRLTHAAHAAVRGTRQRVEHRVKTALSIEAAGRLNETEAALRQMIEVGDGPGRPTVTPQRAVGPYNVDLALAESRVAVEVFGGNWHASGNHAARYRKRLDYLFDAGWAVVVVWVTAGHPLRYEAAEYVVALHERLRRGEPRGRQEHVIWGDGERAPVVEHQRDDGTVVLRRKA